MRENDVNTDQAEKCPLCGEGNDCQRCEGVAYKGPCWCFKVEVPQELIGRLPEDLRGKACICRECVMDFHRQNSGAADVKPGDFYMENGLIVFTAAYHKRRGYCCGSGCRHCPYTADKRCC
jgi:hypothetical protein